MILGYSKWWRGRVLTRTERICSTSPFEITFSVQHGLSRRCLVVELQEECQECRDDEWHSFFILHWNKTSSQVLTVICNQSGTSGCSISLHKMATKNRRVIDISLISIAGGSGLLVYLTRTEPYLNVTLWDNLGKWFSWTKNSLKMTWVNAKPLVVG